MAEFKVGDRVWWTDGRGLRHAAVVIDPAVGEHWSSVHVRLDILTSPFASGWRRRDRLSPRTEHVPELDQEEQSDG